jgi:hypothetical protein
MNKRVSRIVLSLVLGSIGVAAGLYFGRFLAGGAGLPFATSYVALVITTGAVWWAFVGLTGGVGLAAGAVRSHRLRFVSISMASFALGGVVAALPEVARADRASTLALMAIPLGGALAGLGIGLAAGMKERAVIMMLTGALAMFVARPYFALIPPSDPLALLAPGALIGVVLAALVSNVSDTSQTA